MTNHSIDPQNLENLSPADLANQLERIPEEEAVALLSRLPTTKAAEILLELEPNEAFNLISHFPVDQIVAWLQLLPANVIADLLVLFSAERQGGILAALPPQKAATVATLVPYPPDSAGGIMDSRFIAVHADETIEQCLARIRNTPSHMRTADISYVYVIDNSRRLIGVISLRDLVFTPITRLVREIMNPEVRFLRVTDDQEEVARRVQDEHLLGLPVVDENHRLIGVVKIRDAIRVAESEATEDMQLMVGLSGEERIWTPWKRSVGMRLPWLGVNLGTALGGAVVVSSFEGTISHWTALVAFLPLISAVAGNGGNQTLTVIIRSLALGDVTPGDASRALRKELFIGASNGLVLALAIGLLAVVWKGSFLLGAVAGGAMFLNQIIGALSGVAIPFGLRWCGIDPALASSIFVTALTDSLGFLVFLGFAAIGIRVFGL